jgi:PAS domain S-box-containing protein
MLLSFINNIALLLALSICHSFVLRRWKPDTLRYQIATGILFGCITIAGMMNSFVMTEGIIFDGRSFIASVAGVMGGPVTAGIVTLIGGAYRIWGVGGGGVVMGVCVLATSAGLGALYRHWKHGQPDMLQPLNLFLLGVVVHIAMLLWMVTLPSGQVWIAITMIGPPVMLIFPACTALLGTMLDDQIRRLSLHRALRESEENYRELVEKANSIILRLDRQGTITFCNEYALQFFGFTEAELIGQPVIGTIVPEIENSGRSLRHLIDDIFKNPEQYASFENENIRKNGDRVWVSWTNKVAVNEFNVADEILCIGNDITERKKVEEELHSSKEQVRQSYQLLDNIVEHTHIKIVLLDPQFNFIWVNRAYAESCKFEKSYFPGKNHFDLFPHQENQEIFQRVVETGKPFYIAEKPFTYPDQPERGVTYWDWSLVPLYDDTTSLTRLLFTLTEVTERVQAQVEIRFKSQVLDQIQDLVTITDLQGVITYVNNAVLKRLGYTREEIIGQSIAMYASDAGPESAQTEILETTLRDGIWRGEVVNTAADGQEVLLDCRTQTVHDAKGDLIALCGISTDITEAKQTQKLLEKRTFLYNTFLNVSNDGIAIFNQDHRIIEANERFAQMLGYTLDELLTLHTWDFEVVNTEDEIRKEFAYFPEISRVFETLHRRKDGSIFNVEVSANGALVGDEPLIFTINRDSTERKKMEKKVKESEEKFRILFQRASYPIWLVDLETSQFLEFNDQACHFLGYTRDEFAQLHIADIEASDSEEEIKRTIESLIQKGSLRIEKQHRTRNGDIRDVVVSASVIPIQDKLYSLSILRDITEQKRSEKEINRFTELLESIRSIQSMFIGGVESSDVFNAFLQALVKITDSEYGFVDEVLWDDKGEMYKLSLALSDISWDEDSKRLHTELTHRNMEFRNLNNLAGYPAVKGELVIANNVPEDPRSGGIPEGHPVLHNFMGVPLYFGSELVGVVGVANRQGGYSEEMAQFLEPFFSTCSSIIYAVRTKEKEQSMTAGLRQSEEKYRHLFENAPIGIFSTTAQGQALAANQAMARILGFSSPEETVRHYSNLGEQLYVDADRRDEFLALLQEKGYVRDFEYEARTADGRQIWLTMNAQVQRSVSDGSLVIEGFTTDVTKRKLAELEKEKHQTQLLQTQKMDALGTLAGGIAHDFNNILAGIMGFTELTIDLINRTEDEEIYENLNVVLLSASRAKDLVKQILSFSRKKDLEKTVFLPSILVKECLQLLRSTLPTTIEIQKRIYASSQYILGDPTQIHQVMMNLATNAAHAMREQGGTLTVALTEENIELSTPVLPFFETMPGRYLCLLVKDTGHGIDPEIRDRIFDPFFTTKDKSEGTGLGLSVVMGIVKSHHGAIAMESQFDQGTTFRVYLPIHESEASPLESAENAPKGHGERILLVDDEVMLIKLATRMLTSLGYEVTPCLSSEDALETFRQNPDAFDLVLTDQTMPKMKGTQLAKEIIKIRPGMTILLNTGYDERLDASQLEAVGICDLLMKPYTIQELAQALARQGKKDQ